MRMSAGDFLIKRLARLGARYLFGVPGDYNLWFLEQAGRSNRVEFVGCCNELNVWSENDRQHLVQPRYHPLTGV